MMNLVQDFLPEDCACATRMDFQPGNPTSITIHWIGPYPGQKPSDVRKWWLTSGGVASAHFIVKDSDVLQCWPVERVAWHAGCRLGNMTSIGVEVCPCNVEGQFSEESIRTLKELLDTLPRLKLVRHFDWTGKDCPRYYLQPDRWKLLCQQLDRWK